MTGLTSAGVEVQSVSESPTATLPTPAGQVQRLLAALVIALLPLGNVWTVNVGERQFPIPWSWVPVALLVTHFVLTSLGGIPDPWSRRREWPPVFSWLVGTGLALAIPLILATAFSSGLAAYLNFIVGLLGGVAVGWTWATTPPRRLGAVDVGLLFFLVVGASQILLANLSDPASRADISWGRSNFIAGVLVVGAMFAVARIHSTASNRWAYLAPLAAVIMALTTLSRGAVVALSAGVVVLLWNIGANARVRRILRVACVAIPMIALAGILGFTQLRLAQNTQVLKNIDFRFELLALAWSEFLKSPLCGTGWASLRAPSLGAGAENSFAHNFILSFIQIGGVIGIAFVVLFCVVLLIALRRASVYAAPIVAAAAMALTDPFLESFVAGTITFSSAVFVLSRYCASPQSALTASGE
jgi:hypothetical protein